VSKARRSAIHRTSKRIDRHEDACKREHAKMQTAIINAIFHALGPYFTDEVIAEFRADMIHALRKR
jgi:hypothetical protein